MRIKFKDFRSFHEPRFVRLRPITILVGGNSAGKTSFLAGVRFALDFFSRGNTASFNKSPYFLGAYDDIAHFRGGRFGRAPKFTIELEETFPLRTLHRHLRRRRPSKNLDDFASLPKRVNAVLEFDNFRAQPRLSSFLLRADGYEFRIDAGSDGLTIKTPSIGARDLELSNIISEDDTPLDPTRIEYYLLEASFVFRRESREQDRQSTSSVDEISVIQALFDCARDCFGRNVHASAPVRTEPQRIYNPSELVTGSEFEQTPVLLSQISAFDPEKWKKLKSSLEKLGNSSGLFQKIDIKHLSRQKSGPFQITFNVGKTKNSILDVGYGISQALPLALQMLQQADRSVFLFQQPEVHLHPKGQAELASFIGNQVTINNQVAVIETHSDFLIDRIRMDTRDNSRTDENALDTLQPDDVSIVYLKRNELDTQIFEMRLDKSGNLLGAPAGYREFFLRENARSMDF